MTGGIVFNSVTGVIPTTETTVIEYTNTSGDDQLLAEIGGQGTYRSEWFIYIDDVLKVKRRITTPVINMNVDMNKEVLGNTSKVKVSVIHYSASNEEFSSDIRYINIDSVEDTLKGQLDFSIDVNSGWIPVI